MTVTEWHRKVVNDVEVILKDLRKFFPIVSLTKVPVKSWNVIFHGLGDESNYCVKVVNDETRGVQRTLEDLCCSADVMYGLQIAGFRRVMPPIKSQGKDYIFRCGGYWIIVFPWTPYFTNFNLSEDHAQNIQIVKKAAHLLSEMHSFTKKGLPLNNDLNKRVLPQAYKPSIWVAEADTLWASSERNILQGGSSIEAIEKLHSARKLGEEIVEKNSWFFDNKTENEIVIHGDFRPENILLGPGDFCLIIDFDVSHYNYPEVDIAYGALNFSGPRWLIGQRDWRICSSFIDSYKEVSGNINISPHYLRISLLWSIIKALSFSFKEEQVFGRMKLYYEMLENLSLLRD